MLQSLLSISLMLSSASPQQFCLLLYSLSGTLIPLLLGTDIHFSLPSSYLAPIGHQQPTAEAVLNKYLPEQSEDPKFCQALSLQSF